MLMLVLGAIRRRRVQAVLLLVLGIVAAACAAAAPGYLVATTGALAAAAAQQAPAEERVVHTSLALPVGTDGASRAGAFWHSVPQTLVLPDFDVVTSVAGAGWLGAQPVTMVARDGACDQVVLVGQCPRERGDVLLDSADAARRGAQPGDLLSYRALDVKATVPLRVTGTYRPRDPHALYWGPVLAVAATSGNPMLLTTVDTLVDPRLGSGTVTAAVDQIVTPRAFVRTDPQLLALAVEQGVGHLDPSAESTSELRRLADRIWADQQQVFAGVSVSAGALLALCWCALFLAVRLTAQARRADVALVKLRGGRRRDLWTLVVGQSVVPVLLGGVVGFTAAPALAAGLAGESTATLARQQPWYAAVAVCAVAVVGALVAALIAEQRMLAEPVADLSRGVPPRRRAWVAHTSDATAVALAVAVAYQVSSAGGPGARGVGLLAPILLALVAGLLVARLIPVIATTVARRSLAAGRLPLGLASVHIARRRTLSGAAAMMVLATAVLWGAVASWEESTVARHERAAVDVGAARVLLVAAPSRVALLRAVRDIDPDGRYAMAVVEMGGSLPLLAVDSARLAAVTAQAAPADSNWAQVTAELRPPAPAPVVLLTGSSVAIEATWHVPLPPTVVGSAAAGGAARATDVWAFVKLVAADGGVAKLRLGPLVEGRHAYSVPTPRCPPGCRVAGLGMVSAVGAPAPGPQARLVLHRLTQRGPDQVVLDTADLADRSRWRADVGTREELPRVDRAADGLALTVTEATVRDRPILDAAAYRLDAPTPVPVILAGALDAQLTIGDLRADLAGESLPITVREPTRAIARLGGHGLMVDLEYLERVVSDGGASGTMQVWLGPAAPGDAVDRLSQAGLSVISEDHLAERERLLSLQGSATVLRLLVLATVAGMVLALATFLTAVIIERGPRASELAALRRQGLSERVVWRAGVVGYLLVGVAAVLAGVATGALLRPFIARSFPVFGDAWSVLPPPHSGLGLAWSAAGAVLAGLVAICVVAGGWLARASRPDGSSPGRSRRAVS